MKGQSSAEYLIVLSVVLVVGVITLAILDPSFSITSNNVERSQDFAAQSYAVGIQGFVFYEENVSMFLQNNQADVIHVYNITIDAASCSGVPITLGPQQKRSVHCENVTALQTVGAEYVASVIIRYTDNVTEANYTQDALTMTGVVAKEN